MEWLFQRKVSFAEACEGEVTKGSHWLKHEVLVVSHRWFSAREPDEEGMQLEKICEVLAEPKYSGIKYVWYDYWCMPQGADKTPEQKVQFKWMLQNINSLYLGCHVLILLDLSYLSRFWTQFEAWLSMQTATKEGLRPASEAEQMGCPSHP